MGCGGPTFCVGPRPTKPVSRLVFGLWPTQPDDRLVGAPTDRHGGVLCLAEEALERLEIVVVHAIVKLNQTWAARKN